MIQYIQGEITDKSPTYVVLETNGVGYLLHISLNTYTKLADQKTVKLFAHEVIREDAHELFGFLTIRDRDVFRLLISVSGIGANTARMILSSLSVSELEQVILSNNVNTLKSIKGIGLKTAQRIIIDLKDKIGKGTDADSSEIFDTSNNTAKTEALSAMVMLGFPRMASEKVISDILKKQAGATVEEIIKQALKLL